MSGICGWIGFAGAPELLEQMAAPLSRFDQGQVQARSGQRSGVAVAAQAGGAEVYQRDGLLVALWGQPRLDDPALAAQAAAQGVAATVAALWAQGPQRTCHQIHGCFTLAILDERSGEALLATDRMGVQPLTWQLAGETLVFASSADALLRHPLTPGVLDHQGLYNYVYFHMVPSPGTVYQGQQRLLPGHFLHYRQGRVEERSYWRMHFEEEGKRSFGELKEDFLSVLRHSVQEAAGGRAQGGRLPVRRHRQFDHRRHADPGRRRGGRHLFDRFRSPRLRRDGVCAHRLAPFRHQTP